ncbi:MMB_0454 family protein [Mycoplasma corogypsi]|uniref:MMB_0454 family protein n=1 Tax=Mycoplasma corogypsi TaxID=2106 RepID=UPI003872E9BC
MKYLNVNYNNSQTYFVDQNAILNVVEYAITKTKNVKLATPTRLHLEDNDCNVQIFVDIKVKKSDKLDINAIVKSLVEIIETGVKNLLDVRPKNVQIAILGLY